MGNARNLPWFQSLVSLELLFQLPFFFAAMYYISDSTAKSYPDGFRAACIAYGAHTATTLVPILTYFWDPQQDTLTTQQRITLTSMYFPYLAIPFYVMIYAATNAVSKSKTN